MAFLRKIICGALLLLCINVFAMPVLASANVEYEGLEVTIVTDKEHYEDGEPITATITVTNVSNQSVNVVNLEQLIPEGYVLADESVATKSDFEIKAGETVVLEVTMETEPQDTEDGETESEGFVDKLLYGETLGMPNLLLAVLALIAFGIFMLLT